MAVGLMQHLLHYKHLFMDFCTEWRLQTTAEKTAGTWP